MGRTAENLTGRRFGRLVVVEQVPFTRDADGSLTFTTKWRCLCDCGQQTEARRGNLLAGNTRSCGCLRRELARAQMDARHHDVSDLV